MDNTEIEQKIYEISERLSHVESELARTSIQLPKASNADNGGFDAPPPATAMEKFWVQFYISGKPKEWSGRDGFYLPVIYGAKGEKASLGVYYDKLSIELHDGGLYRAFVNKKVSKKVYRGEERAFTTLWVERFDGEFGNANIPKPTPKQEEPEPPTAQSQPDEMDVPF